MNGTPPIAQAQLFQGFSGLANTRAPDLEARADEVLAEFESLFIHQWLSAARSAEDVLFADNPLRSSETELQRDWLDQRMARQLAERGGLGLADTLRRQLRLDGEPARRPPDDLDSLRRNASSPRPTAVAPAGSAGDAGAPAGPAMATGRKPRAPLFPSADAFVTALRPHAERAARALGVAPEGILAQAALETGWGARVPTREDGSSSHNLFGIKAGSAWAGERTRLPTLEHGATGVRREWADFRAYGGLEAAFSDYVALLKGEPRYAERLEPAMAPEAFARALQGAGYATDPSYAEKVARIAASERLREAPAPVAGGVGP